jgi:exodeoxyribonuclease V alpha subunit
MAARAPAPARREPERVRLCAPTGRAAQRLQESLRAGLEGVAPPGTTGPDAAARDLPVTTLHTLLGYQPFSGGYARGPEDPLDADWVLVDEASMVDVFLLAALTRALKPGARLLLVGDADQLPPVDAGAVLGELLPEDRLPRLSPGTHDVIASIFPEDAGALPAAATTAVRVPSVMLDFSHRARGDVVPLADALRSGDADAVLDLLGDALSSEHADAAFATVRSLARIAPGGSDRGAMALSATLDAFAEAAYLRKVVEGKTCTEWLTAFRTAHREDEPGIVKRLWEFAAAARVLAPLRRGTFSTENANRILRSRLELRWGRRGDTPGQGFHGAPVLITRNDRGTGLSNGEVGLWLEAATGPVVFFPRPEPAGWLRLPVTQLPAHEPGFASTVHKSQGSECDEVLILLPEAGNRLLARETLYTAVTRARNRVRIFGTEQAIREAVDKTLRRSGGLRDMMGEVAGGRQ